MSIPPARKLTMDILRLTLDHGQDLQAAVDTVLSGVEDGPDKGLATELSYGYLRLRGRLDFLLNQLLKNPTKTSPVLRRILGVAAYELLYLDRVPEYATLDWAVDLVRKRLDMSLARVANGVLRSLQRLGRSIYHPEYYEKRAVGTAQFLAAWHSSPQWLVEKWLGEYGRELTETYLTSTLTPPPVAVRINRWHAGADKLRQTLQPLVMQSTQWGLSMTSWPKGLDRGILAGAATRQSLASQQIIDALQPQTWPDPILDACAGRGGKTYLLAEMGKIVWASDVNVFRLRQLVSEGRRLDLPLPVFRAPGQGPYPLREAPRTIFLDAPCSGLGVLSRRPDIKWKRTAADCAGLVALQREILDGAASLLPEGGTLAYVTCTLNRDENEHQIAAFLQRHAAFAQVTETTSPDPELGEFFYGAVLRKQ